MEQPNSERAVARNNGVKHSSGEYLAFIDSDDIWLPYKLEKQVQALDCNESVVLSYGQCLRINAKDKDIRTAKRQIQGYSGQVFSRLLFRNFIVSPTPVLRRKAFERTVGFETKYIPYEDWEMWIRLSLLGKFHFIKEPLAYYRIHPTQSVKLTTAKKIEDVTTTLLEDSFRLQEVPEDIKKKSLGLANLRFCYWYLIADETEKARQKIQKAIELHPAFIFDPRWYGLKLVSMFPNFKGRWIFELEQYH